MDGSSHPPRLVDEEATVKDHGTHAVETLAQAKAVDKKYPGSGTHEDPFVVDWSLGDPENPYNWSKARKWLITLQVCQRDFLPQLRNSSPPA